MSGKPPGLLQERPLLCAYEDSLEEGTYYSDDKGMISGYGDGPRDVSRIATEHASPQDCTYCGSTMACRDLASEDAGLHRYTKEGCHLWLWNCVSCGWWAVDRREYERDAGPFVGQELKTATYWGTARRFYVDDVDVPLGRLREYLARHPHHVAHTNDRAFELLMRDCVRDALAPCEVIHTGQTGDGGVDLKVLMTDREPYLVQVKRRQNLSRPESVKTVRELNGVLFREGLAKGIVITTANDFTAASKDEVSQAKQRNESYEMRLLAYADVVNMLRLKPQYPYQPWAQRVPELTRKPGPGT